MKIAIVDDNAADRAVLREYIGRYFDNSAAVTEYGSAEDFFLDYYPARYGIIFLDQYMTGMTGMDAAHKLRAAKDDCTLYFTTTSRDFAVEGYLVRAAGYLLKPFDYGAFSESLRVLAPVCEEKYVSLPSGKILLSHILFADMQGHYAHLHLIGREDMPLRVTFAVLTEKLSSYPQFLECFRGCIVNMEHVKRLQDACFILYDGQRVPVRQKELSNIMAAYADYQFKKARGEI